MTSRLFEKYRLPAWLHRHEALSRPPDPRAMLRAQLDRAYKRGFEDGYRAGQAAGTLRAWAWGLWK